MDKRCTHCDVVKPLTEFYKRADYVHVVKYRAWCKACCDNSPTARNRRRYNLKKRHGITLEQWETMFTEQAGKCAICTTPLPKGKQVHVDHCHDTGNIRGLLCNKCNLGLGYFNDNRAYLTNAIKYLDRSE